MSCARRVMTVHAHPLTQRSSVSCARDGARQCYSLCDAIKQIGEWELGTLQNPAAIHLALTLPTSRNAAAFVSDVKKALALLRSDPKKWSGGTAGLYGTLSKLPSAFIEESAKVFLDTMTECVAEAV